MNRSNPSLLAPLTKGLASKKVWFKFFGFFDFFGGKLFGETVPPNNTLFGGTVPPNNTLFGRTLPPNNTLQ